MCQILKGGCGARHPLSYQMSRPDGLPNYVLLIIRSGGEFIIDGHIFTVSPGQALLLAPGTGYSYQNPHGEYMDDWLHFMPSEEQPFLLKCPFLNVPFPVGNTETFTFFIRQLLWEATYTTAPYAAQNIEALFTVLLNHLLVAYEERDRLSLTKPYQKQLQELRLDLQNDASATPSLEACAAKLGISKSYFQHLYTELFGVSFQQDIIQFRIDHARYLLATTDLTLEQVADICGYNNEVHFYRQFKQLTGITPAKYRKRSLAAPTY